MWFKTSLIRIVCAVAVLVVCGTFACADTIRLKDGGIIKGEIVSFAGGKFVIEIGNGSRKRQLTFSAAEVESIRFDAPSGSPNVPDSNRTASYTRPEPKPTPYEPDDVETEPVYKPAPEKPVVKTPVKTDPPKPVVVDPPVKARSQPAPVKSGEKMQPVEWQVKVLADNTSNGWTNSGWVVRKGQRLRIEGDGKISLGHGQSSPPAGLSTLDDQNKLLKSVPTGALIAFIGDDNNDFIYVGAEREFTATRDGALFLGVNEGNLNDNSGSYNVKISVLPDGGQ
jgi:hypothetical protein